MRQVYNGWIWIALAIITVFPALYVKLTHMPLQPVYESMVYGFAILGAASLLAWAAEAAQKDISQSLALAFLALIAVLPEYSVDLYFAIMAAKDPQYAQYAVANMTGSNRLLIGVGWAIIPFLLWIGNRIRNGNGKLKDSGVKLEPAHGSEISILIIASLYSFIIPLKGYISLVDTAVLFALFGLYLYLGSHEHAGEFEAEGPAASICALPNWQRRLVTLSLFAFPAMAILFCAEPFADSLIQVGKNFGIDEFILVQWVAPLASELPELMAVAIFAFKGAGDAALGTLVSSKVNQWTLLIGSLPLAYSLSLGSVGVLAMDSRQVEEVFLTAAQTIFAVILLADLHLSFVEGVVLFVLFIAQLLFPITEVRYGFAIFYIGAALFILLCDRSRIFALGDIFRSTWRQLLNRRRKAD